MNLGGQPVFYETHHFFLTPNALYLLVWNATIPLDQSKVLYWLEAIRARAGKASPVFLVGTHTDLLPHDAKSDILASLTRDVDSLCRRFTNIKGTIFCSANSKPTILLLKEMLASAAFDLLCCKPPVPERVLLLEKAAIERGHAMTLAKQLPIIKWNEFTSLEMKKTGILSEKLMLMDEDEYRDAAMTLRDFGSIQYFAEVAGLRDFVILNPQFLATLFAHFVTVKSSFIQKGILEKKYIPSLLTDIHADMHYSILELCCQFGVVVPLAGEAERYLVSSMLPHNPPLLLTSIWPIAYEPSDDSYEAGRRYDMSFMPPGLYSHFLSKLIGIGQKETFWRNGFVLEFDRVTAFSQVFFVFSF
jgi:hypothetical protein